MTEQVTSTNQVEVPENESGYIQRIYPTHSFYGTGRPIFDSIMLLSGTVKMQDTKFNKIWVVKELGFITMIYRNMISSKSMHFVIHNVHGCEECSVESEKEMGFVRYYEMLPSTEVSADILDA